MSRDLNATLSTDLIQSVIRPILLFEGEFPSGTVRLWNGTGPLTWNTVTWTGSSTLHAIRLAAETTTVEATGIEVQLSGASQEMVSLVLNNNATGHAGRIYLGTLTAAGAVNADPYIIFAGKFDTADIYESAESPVLTLRYESQIIELERGREWRYTTESQRVFEATDRGFEYVPLIQEWKGFWGQSQKTTKKPTKGSKKASSRRTR